MSTSEKNRFDGNYLERYRNGLLTPAEAHALEKAALEDPLLADALDGYLSAERDTSPERSYLKTWISDRVEENQAAIRYIPRTNNFQPFLRVAAVFLVLIGAAWMGYILWLEPKAPVLADRGTEEGGSIVQTPPPIQSNQPVDDSIAPTPRVNPTPTPQPVTITTEPVVATIDPVEIKAEGKETESVVQADATPLVQATPKQITDTEEKATADQNRAVVVENRNAQLTESRSTSAFKRNQLAQEEPTPVNGWANFETYINQTRQITPTPNNRNVSAVQVTLSFAIGEDGRPRDIRVERSGGSQNDKQAIDLLLKGPDWKAGKPAQRGQVQIRF